jgi:hypothetical protein
MRKAVLLIVASVALVNLTGLVTPTSTACGDIVFDDFNDGEAGTPLTARTAITGQVWDGPAFGGASLLMTTGSGQGGTLGVGSTSNPFLGADNALPLGQELTSGKYVYSADITVLDPRPRNQLFIVGDVLGPNSVTFGMDRGAIFFEGVYLGQPNVPTGFGATQVGYNIHLAVTFDLDTETGSVSWYDLDDPTDASTKGDVELGTFPNGAGVGNYAFTRLIVSETPPSAGFDNIRLAVFSEGLAGDYNSDGTVDAADYTVWRDNLGAADETVIGGNGDGLNGVDQGDYLVWKSNFGTIAGPMGGGSSLGQVPVPEPATSVLAIVAAMAWLALFFRSR